MTNKNLMSCDCDAIHIEVVNKVKQHMPNNEMFNNLSDFYKMFSDNTRIKILWALSQEEMCVCDLAFLLNMTKSAISHQLKALRIKKIVKHNKRGRNVYYSLVECHIKDIFEQGFQHILE